MEGCQPAKNELEWLALSGLKMQIIIIHVHLQSAS